MNYYTIAEADAYFATRVNSNLWTDSSNADKTKALTQATRIIDSLAYSGEQTDSDQENEFPRGGDTTAPEKIGFACAEIAFALLDDVDPEQEFDNLRMVAQGYANVRSTYDIKRVPLHTAAGVPSSTAWRYLSPYLADSRLINVNRAS